MYSDYHTRRSLLGLAIASVLLSGCDWEDKHEIVDCSAAADPNVSDCRSIEDDIDSVATQPLVRDVSALQDLVAVGTESWSPSHADELDVSVTASGNLILVASKYHNRLRTFQSDNAGHITQLADTGFLTVSGGRYAIDGVSGASEQVLSQVQLQTDGDEQFLLSIMEPYNHRAIRAGTGLYRHALNSPDAPPAPLMARTDNADYLPYQGIRTTALSPDGDWLAVAGRDRKVNVFAANSNFSTALGEASLDITVHTASFDQNASRLYLGGSTIVGQLLALEHDVDSQTLTEQWRVTLDDTPQTLVSASNGSVIALLSSGNELIWISADGQTATAIELASQASGLAINHAATRIAVSDVSGGVELIDLGSGARAYRKPVGPGEALGVAIDANDTVWLLSQRQLLGFQAPVPFGDVN